MQIPENLIRLIETGKAQYRTAALGAAGAYSIPVPENKYIIIFGYTFNHFFDSNVLDTDLLKLTRALHHLQFQSKSDRWLYNHRSLPSIINVGTALGPIFQIYATNPAETISVYQIHKSDVNITIWNARPTNQWSFTYAAIPKHTGTIENPVLGVGMAPTGLLTTQRISNEPTMFRWIINPISQRNKPVDGARFEFSSPIIAQTVLKQPRNSTTDGLYSFPLLNVYYVVVDKGIKSENR